MMRWSICRGAMSNPLYSSMEFANVGLGMGMMGETQHRSSARRSVVKPAEVVAPELLSTMRHMQLAHAMPSTSNYCVPVVSNAKLAIRSRIDLSPPQIWEGKAACNVSHLLSSSCSLQRSSAART